MSIKLKLLVGCLCLTFVTLILGTFAQNSQKQIGTLAVQIYDDALIATNALRSAQNAVYRLQSKLGRMADPLQGGVAIDPANVALLKTEIVAILSELRLAKDGALSADGHGAVDLLRQRLSRLRFTDGAISHRLLMRQIGALDDEFSAAVRIFGADAYRVRSTVTTMVRSSVNRTWLAMALAGLVALLISVALSRAIVPALRSAMKVAKSISEGKFDNDIRVSGRSETAELLNALAVMQDSISRHFGTIETAAASQADLYDGQIAIQNVRFEAALDNMTQGLCMFDAQQRLVVVNRHVKELFGPLDLGLTMKDLTKFAPLGAIFEPKRDAFFTHETEDGKMIAVSRQAIVAGGQLYTFEDVTDRHNAALKLRHMADHDALTGLPNRTRLSERLQEILSDPEIAVRAAVLCLDLDGFKFVNDTLGHPVGDVLLQAVASRLLDIVGPDDLVARTGGDEFAIIHLSDDRGPTSEALAKRLITRLGEPFNIDHQRITIGVSIGIVADNTGNPSSDGISAGNTLMKNADLALYGAKAKGRNTFCFFQRAMDERIQARRRTELDLETALQNGEFELCYQPFVNVAKQSISGFEALIRWRHPTRGMVSPAEFITVAEEVGLIDAVGLFVLETACREAAGWPSGIKVSVNLSPIQFRNPDLLKDVKRVLKETKLPPRRLQLEITENVLLHDTESVLAILNSFRKLGIGISMDDFGTGYSSLGYLTRFPFDKVKIDQSFVRDLAKRENIAVVRAVLGLSKAMGISAIAEGVETTEQRDILLEEGCDEMQGYLFSRPRPLAELPQLLMRFDISGKGAASAAASSLIFPEKSSSSAA
ncbi:MAG: EAL domain-containing protein [Rhizobiaceae bacterium]|nr:EAL domain-containing protein [Rhizobiaceae bacterium]